MGTHQLPLNIHSIPGFRCMSGVQNIGVLRSYAEIDLCEIGDSSPVAGSARLVLVVTVDPGR